MKILSRFSRSGFPPTIMPIISLVILLTLAALTLQAQCTNFLVDGKPSEVPDGNAYGEPVFPEAGPQGTDWIFSGGNVTFDPFEPVSNPTDGMWFGPGGQTPSSGYWDWRGPVVGSIFSACGGEIDFDLQSNISWPLRASTGQQDVFDVTDDGNNQLWNFTVDGTSGTSLVVYWSTDQTHNGWAIIPNGNLLFDAGGILQVKMTWNAATQTQSLFINGNLIATGSYAGNMVANPAWGANSLFVLGAQAAGGEGYFSSVDQSIADFQVTTASGCPCAPTSTPTQTITPTTPTETPTPLPTAVSMCTNMPTAFCNPTSGNLKYVVDDNADFYLNGNLISSQVSGFAMITTYNLTPADLALLQTGVNILGVYGQDIFNDLSAVSWVLTLNYTNCATQYISSSSGSFIKDTYVGNYYGTPPLVFPPGWNTVGFDDSAWSMDNYFETSCYGGCGECCTLWATIPNPATGGTTVVPFTEGRGYFPDHVQGDGYLYREYFYLGNPVQPCNTTGTPTLTATISPTRTDTGTATPTATITATRTVTNTGTTTYTASSTATITDSPTVTLTGTSTDTSTPTATATTLYSSTSTYTATNTATASVTATITLTSTITVTPSVTLTSSMTWSPSLTLTPSQSFTQTHTATVTATNTPVMTNLELKVYNEAGEVVKTFSNVLVLGGFSGIQLSSGSGSTIFDPSTGIFDIEVISSGNVYHIPWDGKSDLGYTVDSGQYVLKADIPGKPADTVTMGLTVLKAGDYLTVSVYTTSGELVKQLYSSYLVQGQLGSMKLTSNLLQISNQPTGTTMIGINIFSSTGQLMADGLGSLNQARLTWDGTTALGNYVQSGEYLIKIEQVYNHQHDVVVQSVTVLSSNLSGFMDASVYPNPYLSTPDHKLWFKVTLQDQSNLTVRIYDVVGELVNTLSLPAAGPGIATLGWDVNNAAAGLYVGIVEADSQVSGQTQKKSLKISIIK